MTNDEAEYDARRQVRAQADADVAAFIESLGQDEGTGVPPPVRINITDVSTKPVKFSPFAFGREDSGASPGPKVPPSSVPWACCLPDDSCEMLPAADCAAAGGTFNIGQTCGDNPCSCPRVRVTATISSGWYKDPISGCRIDFGGTSFTTTFDLVRCGSGCACTSYPSYSDTDNVGCDCSGEGGCENTTGGNVDVGRTADLSTQDDGSYSCNTGFWVHICSVGGCAGALFTGGGTGVVGTNDTFITNYSDTNHNFIITTVVEWL